MTFRLADASIGGVPLHSVPATVMDTETTGLNPATDRVVQIGAIQIEKGRLDANDTFDRLVNPSVSIPPATTKIHGIRDADVADAPAFQIVMREFAAWAGARLVIGYSIGFDLAVLRAECARSGLGWHRPRSLDVRDLVEIVAPDLPQGSLDIAAEWLGIAVDGRHNALGDARATADIYLALLPKLAEKGIVTLAQAERACLRQVGTGREAGRSAGWEEVVEEARLVPASVNEYARIDSFPYRHRIRDIMNAPPRTIDANRSLGEALEIMMRERISSVFTVSGAGPGADGILTERDILRAINTGKADALNSPVAQHASGPLATIGQDEFVYRAIVDMSARSVRHLGVHDHSGAVVGALSARDLLKQRASDAISLGDSIASADTAEELGTIWSELTVVARGLVYEEVDARDIAAVISNELRALTRRACELAELEFLDAGEGSPPVPYAMLVLGSGGRGESLLAMDQDNAIVYQDLEDVEGKADAWFKKLGKRVADILNSVGVAYCQGGVMAQNEAWRMGESRWRKTVARWISRSQPDDILNADIFFDCRPVHGAAELGDALRREAIDLASQSRNFQRTLATTASRFDTPIGMFGRFRLTNGRVDLKKCGLFPIVSTARVLALRHGVAERSTPGRLEAIANLLEVQADVANSLIEAHKILLDAVLRQQLRDLDRGVALSNAVRLNELSKREQQELRWALEQIQGVPNLLGTPLFTAS